MINNNEDISFITDENGKEVPIQVLDEFEREDNGHRFVIYSDIADSKDTDEEREFLVARIVKCDDGSEELVDVDDEDDFAYCQEHFNDLVDQMSADELSDFEDDDEDVVSA